MSPARCDVAIAWPHAALWGQAAVLPRCTTDTNTNTAQVIVIAEGPGGVWGGRGVITAVARRFSKILHFHSLAQR
jgi:hypothetical protein